MELGKGDWGDNPADRNGPRGQYLGHMANYDRIFIPRALQKAPRWRQALVEIPLGILQLAKDGELEMKLDSRRFRNRAVVTFAMSGERPFSVCILMAAEKGNYRSGT